MGEVIALSDLVDEECLSGAAICTACQHRWEAVIPIGVNEFECPACHTQKGLLVSSVSRDELVYTCTCGGQLFYILKQGCYCRDCGQWAVME